MAVDFNLFEAPPSEEGARPAPAQEADDLNLFVRPPGQRSPEAPRAEPERVRPEPPVQEEADDLDLFARPPGQPRRRQPAPAPEPEAPSPPAGDDDLNLFVRPPRPPSRRAPRRPERPEPAPEAPAAEEPLDLFVRPPGAPERPQAQPAPEPAPEAAPAPAPQPEAPARGRPQRERADFEQDELWDQFLVENYQRGRARVPHPDPRRRRRYPEVMFSTAMGYPDFRQQVGREFEVWKGRRQPDDMVGRQITDPQQLQEGDVLRSSTGREIKVSQVLDDSRVRYHWKKEDGSWSRRRKTMRRSTFAEKQFRLQSRGAQQAQPEAQRPQQPAGPSGPRAQVGEQVQSADRLRPGDIIRSSPGRERRVLEINGDRIKTQRLDADGNPMGDPQTYGIRFLQDHEVHQHALPPRPRGQVGEQVQSADRLRPGDVIRRGENRSRRVVWVDGNQITTQLLDSSGQTTGEPQTHDIDYLKNHDIVEVGGRGEQQQPEPEPEQPSPPGEKPHIPLGTGITHPRQLRVGDTFRNSYLKSQNRYRKVTEIKDDGTVMARLFDANDRPVEAAKPFTEAVIRQYQEYKRFVAPGQAIRSPGEASVGLYLRRGDKLYRVVHKTSTGIEVQDVHDGRGVGRPTKLSKSDLESGEYKSEKTPRQGEQGERITDPTKFRSGQVVKALHHRDPKWVRVVFASPAGVKVQPIDPETGDAKGEPETYEKTDLKRWAYLTKTSNLPEALLPPLEAPPGGFARPGEGKLTSNMQPGRYDNVTVSMRSNTEEKARRLLGITDPNVNVGHVLADLAGAGGLARSLRRVTIESTSEGFQVSGAGEHIRSMSRQIKFRNGEPYQIYNSIFELESSAPKGMGLKMFATQVASALKHGFDHIKVQAAGSGPWRDGTYNGYYVWPRFGYDAKFPSHYWHQMPERVKEQVRRIRPGAPQGLRYLDLMEAGKDARDWWKDNGDASYLKFKLGPRSRSVRYLTSYVQDVAKKDANVGADRFLNRAADGPKEKGHEWYPTFGPEEEEISDKIWDRMGEETREQNEKKNKKNKRASINLAKLAQGDVDFRYLLLKELGKGGS